MKQDRFLLGILIGIGVLIIAALVVFFIRTWVVSEKGRRVWEGLMLRAPIVGPLVAQFVMARFCRMLGTLLGAGVPLVQALNVARKSIGNQILPISRTETSKVPPPRS